MRNQIAKSFLKLLFMTLLAWGVFATSPQSKTLAIEGACRAKCVITDNGTAGCLYLGPGNKETLCIPLDLDCIYAGPCNCNTDWCCNNCGNLD